MQETTNGKILGSWNLAPMPMVVSYWVVEGVRRRHADAAFAKRFDECDERLGNVSRLEGEAAGRS